MYYKINKFVKMKNNFIGIKLGKKDYIRYKENSIVLLLGFNHNKSCYILFDKNRLSEIPVFHLAIDLHFEEIE